MLRAKGQGEEGCPCVVEDELVHDDHAARLQSGDGLADDLFAIIRSFPMEDLGKQDDVIGSFDFIFKIITAMKACDWGRSNFSDHLFGEAGLRQVRRPVALS